MASRYAKKVCVWSTLWAVVLFALWEETQVMNPIVMDEVVARKVYSDTKVRQWKNRHRLRNSRQASQSESGGIGLGFLVVGDYGTGDMHQKAVAENMDVYLNSILPQRPAFVLSTGDQIYESGIRSENDPLLQQRFESVYNSANFVVPWYITIGNHDCEGSIDAMLQYAKKNSRWRLPSRYYYVDHVVDRTTIMRMIVLDACDLVCGQEKKNFRCVPSMNAQTSPESRERQLKWLDWVLSQPLPSGVKTMWRIVVGHWAVYSYAGNGSTKELIDSVEPLMKKYKVHAYFNGHDHCMQHILRTDDVTGWSIHYFVSGAGGYRLHELEPKFQSDQHPDLVRAELKYGFMYVQVQSDRFHIQMIEANTLPRVLYETEVNYDIPDDIVSSTENTAVGSSIRFLATTIKKIIRQ